MRATIAIFATLLAAGGAFAQQFGSGPFSREEAEVLSTVWPEIREAAEFEDINWRAYGLSRAPGDTQARRLMATHWDELRRAGRFDDIDWQATAGYRTSSSNVFADDDEAGPFTSREAELMSRVWPEIRQAAAFEDIDWQRLGLPGAPGNRDARRLMATHWDSLRREERFTDIDWRDADWQRDRPTARVWQRDDSSLSNPFTRQEAAEMSRVWPEIREAGAFDDIDWQGIGLARAPGDRQARRLMADHWDSLRREADFEDIDWDELTRYHDR